MRLARRVLPLLLAASALAMGIVSASDLDAVRKRGELRVVAMVDDPQDEFFTDRPGTGLDRELLEAFASLHKYFGHEAPEVLKRARSETER